ncbi:MAG: hypothetical protein OXH57_02200 [Ekhidna sp.]|nr:hypothetical protein [Ekhidna sp.]
MLALGKGETLLIRNNLLNQKDVVSLTVVLTIFVLYMDSRLLFFFYDKIW